MINIKNVKREEFYSVPEVAGILGYKTNQSVYNLIASKKIETQKGDKSHLISGESVLKYLEKEKGIKIEERKKISREDIEEIYNRKLSELTAKYEAGFYDKGYYTYAKKQLEVEKQEPPRCPYCDNIIGKDNSVFNREINDTYHICKDCERIIINYLNRPRSVHTSQLEQERRKINGKLYFTLEGLSNLCRVSQIDLQKQVLPYRLEIIKNAIEEGRLKTVLLDGETLIEDEIVYKIMDICINKKYTFDDYFNYEK